MLSSKVYSLIGLSGFPEAFRKGRLHFTTGEAAKARVRVSSFQRRRFTPIHYYRLYIA